MPEDDDHALIDRLREAFTHNIKSPSEAAHLRSNIAERVNSYIVYDDEAASRAVPTRVNPLGQEITSVRRRYLESLQANIEARERYQRARVTTRSLKPQQQHRPTDVQAMLSHLELAALDKRKRTLDIHSRYVRSLSQDASSCCNLGIHQPEQQHRGVSIDEDASRDEATTAASAEIESLTAKLHRAVLQANHQLERQKVLLAEVKQKPVNDDANSRPADESTAASARARAIAATRNVLVTWLDERLSETGAEAVRETSNDVDHDESNGHESTDPPPSISEHYQKYLSARRTAMDAASQSLRPLSAAPTLPPPAIDEEILPGEQSFISDGLSTIHTLKHRLAPALHAQADVLTLTKYATAAKARERQDTIAGLERLADESQLLSEYATGAFEGGGDELVGHVAAWKEALAAAGAATAEAVQRHEREGLLALEDGERELVELRGYYDGGGSSGTRSGVDGGINWRGMHGRLGNEKVV